MSLQARVIYDFEGDTENGELVIEEGTIIKILNQDIGDGWWEGQLADGTVGLFPESYVEVLEDGEDSSGAPAAMNGYEGVGNGAVDEDQVEHSHGFGRGSFSQNEGTNNKWEEEEEDWEVQQKQDGYGSYEGGEGIAGGETGSMGSNSRSRGESQLGRAGTVKKNINRFSSFVKTGAEAFILGHTPNKVAVQRGNKIKIVISPENTPMWELNPEPYEIEVKDPEKKKKFKGIKSFMAYSIIPSSTGRGVSRRYKHYDWLHDRLEEKFTIHCVPPLPDKKYYGRYGEDFIEKRREKLQRWSNRIARHPILSRSDVFSHFILCDDEGPQWKTGKRRAEKDDIVGAAYLHTVEHPDVSVDINAAESTVEAFGAFIRQFKLSLSRMRMKFIDHCNQMSGPFDAEFNKMAAVFNALAMTFAMENKQYAQPLTDAIDFTAKTYAEIGKMHNEQPRNDMLPAMDVMKEYLGLLFSFPDVVTIHRGAVAKVRGCEKMKEECRIDVTEATDIISRAESVSGVVLSEIYHFQHERVVDFRDMMQQFLDEQINFYKEIIRKLEEARSQYNDATDL